MAKHTKHKPSNSIKVLHSHPLESARGRECQSHQVFEGHFLFLNEGHTWPPASSVFLLLSYGVHREEEEEKRKEGVSLDHDFCQ